jgi:hypothetical protein
LLEELPPPELQLEPELPMPPPVDEGVLPPGSIDETLEPRELARSFTCSTTRLMTVRAAGRVAAAAAPTAAAAPVAAAARFMIFLVRRFAAVFFPPLRPAAARFELLLDRFDELRFDDLFFDDFFEPPLRDPPFFDDFFEERFFAAMGHSPFQSVGGGIAVT